MNLITLTPESQTALRHLAANVGIDFDPSLATLGFNRKPKVIDRAYKGRSVYYISQFMSKKGSEEISFKFHTKKGGGKTETWTTLYGHPDYPLEKPASHAIRSVSVRGVHKASTEKIEVDRIKAFESYKKAFDSAPLANSKFPFLVNKNINIEKLPIVVKELSNQHVFGPHGNPKHYLGVSIRNANDDYLGFEKIFANGSRRRTPTFEGVSMSGGFALIGSPRPGRQMWIAESFSTAAAIYQSTGQPVAIAFSVSNLGNAATELKLAYQDSKLAIAGDWDGDTQGNSGVFYAMKVAKQLRIPLFLPSTANGQKIDYNDIYKDFGEEGVKTRLAQKAYRLPVPQDRLSYLLKLLEYAPEAHLNQVIKGIASASLLGDKISVDDLSTKVHKIAEDRIERAEVSALLADFLRAKTKRLAKHSTISAESVDFQENFLAEVGENGNMKIPSMVLQRIEHHMGKDRIILLQSPTGTGKTQEVFKTACRQIRNLHHWRAEKGISEI